MMASQEERTMNVQSVKEEPRKHQLMREWGDVRERWKRRKFDLRTESDVGRAVRLSLDKKGVVTDESRPRVNALSAVTSSKRIDLSSNSKFQFGTGQPLPTNGSMTLIDVADSWASGHQTPRVLHSYFGERVDMDVTSIAPSFPIDGSTATFGSAPTTSSKIDSTFSLQRSYFASVPQVAPIRFTNLRFLQSVLSAILLGEECTRRTRRKAHRRLATVLWDPSFLQFVSDSPLRRCTRQNGTLLIIWGERLEAAISLGIASSRRVRGPLRGMSERYLDNSSTLRLVKRLKRIAKCCAGGKRQPRAIYGIYCNSLPESEAESALGTGSLSRMLKLPRDVPFETTGFNDHYGSCWSRECVSHVARHVTLSTLIRESSLCLQPDKAGDARRKIVSISGMLVVVCHDSLQKCIAASRKGLDVPLVDYASALDTACAVSSNPLPSRFVFEGGKEGGVYETSSQQVAKTFAARWLHATGPRFAQVHVKYSLLRFAQGLPGRLSALFVESLNVGARRTPFESLRWFLDHLEDCGFLTEVGRSTSDSGAVLRVEELESMLFDFSESLMRMNEREPFNLACRCWHLALLASCMLLCSGNRLDGGAAHRFPSGLAEAVDDRNVVLSSMNRGTVCHERRRKLPKFHWLRQQTSRSFRVLLNEDEHRSQSAQWHLAIVSFLEWSQVVALLLGSSLVDWSIRQINRDHERHSTWVSAHSSTLECTTADPELSAIVAVEGCASLLESNPAERLHWVRLVESLGPFDDLTYDKRVRSFKESKASKGCRVLASKVDDAWWGRDRILWWGSSILAISASPASGILSPSHLEACRAGEGDNRAFCQEAGPFGWLKDIEVDDYAGCENDTRSPIERGRNFANCLPASQSRSVKVSSDLSEKHVDVLRHEFEIDLFKLVLRGHLYGTSDPVFQEGVVSIARDAWDYSNGSFRRNTHAFVSLLFLQQKGLSLTMIFERARIPCDALQYL